MRNNRQIFFAGFAIVLAALAAYHNTFNGPFVFDDSPSITDNPSIRQLWPLTGPLNPPGNKFGLTVSGRPILNLSLALNYFVSGTQPWSYHGLNLLIHAAAGLVLFGLVRRTLLLPSARPGGGIMAARGPNNPNPLFKSHDWSELATPTAFVAALLWTLHPLQTESVTYVIQRAESLMGFFYLLTLYGFVRMAEPGGKKRWGVISFLACLSGMGCKEVMVTAPVLVLWYDRVFFGVGFKAAVRRHARYYLSLAATWILLAALVLSTGGDRGGTFTMKTDAMLRFWLTQPEALARYLGLTIWPHPLVFEYGLAMNESPAAIVGYSLVIALCLALIVWWWRRYPPAALGLGAFFLVLAPTSLMPGAVQVMTEHRLYVPLAGLLAVTVVSVVAWQGRRGLVVCLLLAIGAGVMTEARNRVYRTEFSLWADTVEKRPTSAKAHNSLARLYYNQGNFKTAIEHGEVAVRLEPGVAQPYFNLGLALQDSGRPAEAAKAYAEAVRILPYFGQAHAQWGILLAEQGRKAEAAEHLQTAFQYNPDLAEGHLGMGLLLASDGRDAEAVLAFERALQLSSAQLKARLGLGTSLARLGRLDEAEKTLRRLVTESPALCEAHANLGIVLAEKGDPEAALACYREALRLQPAYAEAHYNMGNTLARLQRWQEAKEEFGAALRIAPDFQPARDMLERIEHRETR